MNDDTYTDDTEQIEELPPGRVLLKLQELAGDPDSALQPSDLATAAANVADPETLINAATLGEGSPDAVALGLDETRRIANSLEHLYYDTRESAYEATDEQAALDSMMLRDRGRIEPNPELLDDDQSVDTGTDREDSP